MKRLWIITLAALVVILGAITAWRLRPASPPADSLYGRYSQRSDVRVGLLHDFALGDSLKVDVVTIEAHDSAGWRWMQDEFDIYESSDRTTDNRRRLLAWAADSGRYIFCLPERMSLCIVEAADSVQLRAITQYHIQLLKQ